MNKYIVGQEGTGFMVLEKVGETYRVIARCPNRDDAERIVAALFTAANNVEERLSYGGR